ncbi:hypothetical protein AB1N83_011244 [Pleurotus pulmonarius]
MPRYVCNRELEKTARLTGYVRLHASDLWNTCITLPFLPRLLAANHRSTDSAVPPAKLTGTILAAYTIIRGRRGPGCIKRVVGVQLVSLRSPHLFPPTSFDCCLSTSASITIFKSQAATLNSDNPLLYRHRKSLSRFCHFRRKW